MAKALFRLNYDSGILRDGTKYQGKYCTDAQWCRFQRKRLRKIGGMKGIPTPINPTPADIGYTTNIIDFTNADDTLMVLSTSKGFFSYLIDPALNLIASSSLLTDTENLNIRTTSTLVKNINTGIDSVLFMQSFDLNNINDTTPARFYSKPLVQLGDPAINFQLNALVGVDPRANSGIYFISPYLFVYGANGVLQHSKTSDPFDFDTTATVTTDTNGIQTTTPSSAGSIPNLGTDRIIYMSAVRGGTNSPSFLVWTLTSVIRVTNIGTDRVIFNTDVVSRTNSILSSRCVVENNGIFYWIGTNSFYTYNGVVRKIKNNLNHNYFFQNVDLDQSQKIFGINFDQYNEIWWFYPVKGSAGNTRVLIHNYDPEELSWYDSAISREAAVFSVGLKHVITAGFPLISSDANKYIWAHEIGVTQNWTPVGSAIALDTPIPSSFTTPLVSFASFPPIAENNQGAKLLDRWTVIYRLEPDFISSFPIASNFELVINGQEFAQSIQTHSAVFAFTGGILGTTPQINVLFQARNLSFTFSSSNDFEVGNINMLLSVGDAI